ncbi:hypothetical protein ACSVBT_03405 [Afipia sp. TerB]
MTIENDAASLSAFTLIRRWMRGSSPRMTHRAKASRLVFHLQLSNSARRIVLAARAPEAFSKHLPGA